MHKRNALYSLALAVFFLTLAVYSAALRNDFVLWDDNIDVYGNVHIRSLSWTFFQWAFSTAGKSMWEPMTWMSFALDHALWGSKPAGYHLTSILLHAANTALVTVVIARLFDAAKAPGDPRTSGGETADRLPASADRNVLLTAGAAGALFGLHPLQVESVAWVSARPSLLYTLFFLLSVMAYLRYATSVDRMKGPDAGPSSSSLAIAMQGIMAVNRHYLFSFGLFILAAAGKASAIVLPLVLLLLDWYPLKRMTTARKAAAVFLEKAPFIAISVIIAIVTFSSQKALGTMAGPGEVPFVERGLVAVKAISMYLWNIAVPVRLVPLYPYPQEVSIALWEYSIAAALFLGISLVCLVTAKRRPLFLAAWFFFLITLAPVIGVVKVREVYMADRYAYLPGVAPFLIAGLFAAHIRSRVAALRQGLGQVFKRAAIVSGVVLVAALMSLTLKQIAVWKNSITFWNYVIEQEPSRAPAAYLNRGLAFAGMARFDLALQDFTTTIALGPPRYLYLAYNHRGMALADTGRLDQAMENLNTAISLAPDRQVPYRNRGLVFGRMGQYERAIVDLNRAISMNPTDANAYIGRGLAFMETGRLAEALRDLDQAVTLDPGNAEALLNRGLVFYRSGQMTRALSDYSMVISLNPSDHLAYSNRGIVYRSMGQPDRAIEDLSRAITLKPDFSGAYLERGDIYLNTGKQDLANRDLQTACELGNEAACDALSAAGKHQDPTSPK